MKVFPDFDRPACHKLYAVAGRLLFVESYNRELAERLDHLFAGWNLTTFSSSSPQPQLIIRCFCNGSVPEVPPGFDEFLIAGGGGCYTNGESLFLDLGNAVVWLSAGKTTKVELWFRKLPSITEPNFARATSFAVCAGLRRHGLFEVHGAGLSAPHDGSSVLVIGASGSGKSTLALNLASAGWNYLSDDEVLLERVDDQIEARGFRNFFAVSSETLKAFSIAALSSSNIQPEMPHDSKVCFEPAGFFSSMRLEKISPRVLLFSRIANRDTTELTELSQAETMVRLLRSCPWATYDKAVAAENLNVLSLLARHARGFDLLAGHDLLFPGRAAEMLLARAGAT